MKWKCNFLPIAITIFFFGGGGQNEAPGTERVKFMHDFEAEFQT